MNVRIPRAALALAVIASGCVAGGPSVSYKLNLKPYQLDMTDFAFPSGLRILFQEDHSEPTVLVTALYGVGSTSEPQGKEGMAHLVEHLCFKARHGNKPEVWDHMRQLGASNFNAFTTQDITQYYMGAPKEALLELLQIEALRMIDPLAGVTEEELKTEREVVRNELRLRIENEPGAGFELASEMLFPKSHPYHRSVIGSHESLDNITLADAKAFTDKYYRPENVTIVVTGDFNRAEAGAMIGKTFPKKLVAAPGAAADAPLALVTPKPRITGPSEEPPPPADKSVRHIKAPVASTQVILAWTMPGAYRENQPLMEVTASALSSAVGSLLYPDSSLAADDEIEGLGCGANPQPLATTVYCFIELIEGQEADVIAKKALDGLVEMWNTDNQDGLTIQISAEDYIKLPGQRQLFNAARSQYQAQLFRRSASLDRAVEIAQYMHYTAKPDYFASSLNEIAKVNSFDARNLAYKYLTRERAIVLVLDPFDAKEKPVSAIAADSGSSYAGAILSEGSKSIVDYSKVTPAQIAALGRAPDVSKIKEMTLANGLKVTLAKHGAAPFVTVGYFSHGGSETVRPAHFTDFAFSDFTAQDPGQIAADWFGTDFGDGQILGVEAPSGNVDAAIDLVRDRVTSTVSAWDRKRFTRTSDVLKRRIKTEEKRPEIWADRALWNLLLPGNPRGVPYDWAALEKLDNSHYERWWKDVFAPKNSHLFVVGDIDLELAEKTVTSMFGTWRAADAGGELPGYKPVTAKPVRQIAMIDDKDATQASLTVGCHLTKKDVATDAAKDVLSAMLSQDLFVAIRKRAGASYGVYASDFALGETSLMVVGGAIQNDKAVPGLRTILDRMGELKSGKVDPLRLTETKWSLAAATRTANQSNQELLFRLVDLSASKRPLATLTTYPERLAKVTEKDIAAILEPCAGHEIVTVTGPAKALKPSLESLKMPIEDVDWKKGSDAKPAVN